MPEGRDALLANATCGCVAMAPDSFELGADDLRRGGESLTPRPLAPATVAVRLRDGRRAVPYGTLDPLGLNVEQQLVVLANGPRMHRVSAYRQ